MSMNIKIFLPNFLLKESHCLFFGYYEINNDESVIYVTSTRTETRNICSKSSQSNVIYGRFGKCDNNFECYKNWLDVDTEELSVTNLVLNGHRINQSDFNVIILFYDYKTFSLAENWQCPDETLRELHDLVKIDSSIEEDVFEGKINESIVGVWLMNVQFLVQLKNFADSIAWVYKSLRRNKKVTFKSGNIISVLLLDIALGCLVIALVDVRSQSYREDLMIYIADVVDYLRSLLKWLMGAPAGLKLNMAFNNMLNKFFLYHINLWWKFLDLTRGCLQIVSTLYFYFGFLGVTFQAAIVSDMISFFSFHAYCIYVYIARLFNIQMRGVGALFRLFVGRKRNPLRACVDSCEYTSQQLFLGTVGFTVLLFLLPTSAVYYIVFTLFRLVSLGVKGILSRVCRCIRNLPLYVSLLRLVGSPRIAGEVRMSLLRERTLERPLVLSLHLESRSAKDLVQQDKTPSVDWVTMLRNVLEGTLISCND